MADPDESDAQRIDRLQQELAQASAQLSRVQAELHDVTGTRTSRPFALSGAGDDPTARLDARQSDQIRELLARLGVDADAASVHRFSNLAAVSDLAPDVVPGPAPARLTDPPRRVPVAFRLAVFGWSWWEGFGVLMGLTAPIALWGFFPFLIPAGCIAGLLVIVALRGRRSARRLGLLRWGKVVTVTKAEEISRGTYYAGTTYNNMLVSQARGWAVTRRWYSGPASTTRIDYTIDGVPGSMMLRGLPYDGGVVLADSRRPNRALCVSQFPYDVAPDASGELVGHLRVGTWIGIVATLVVEGALVAGAVAGASYFWFG